jgi:hypothetical protein
LFPKSSRLRRLLVNDVVKLNPQVFPEGTLKPVAAGTLLFFPELRGLSERAGAPPPIGRAAKPSTRQESAAAPPDAEPSPESATPVKRPARRRTTEAAPGEPVRLRRALELGEKPGPQECRSLMPLCGVEQALREAPPALDEKARGIESGMNELRLKQESIDGQLARLEQSLAALQKVVATASARPPVQPTRPVPPAPPPKPEIRTVVKTEPLPWYYWAGFAAIAMGCAVGGFAFGRRRAYSGSLGETDERLDEMLASAATAIREFDAKPAPPPKRVVPWTERPTPNARPVPPPAREPEPPAPHAAPEADINLDQIKLELGGQAIPPATDVDVQLDSGPVAQSIGLSSKVLFEMDQALDNTRSMFTDVDRFIALGRTQNAVSLLQFQVHKDPKDRDSWIKLMAIYRQEKMDSELASAAREFKRQFPGEDTTG